MSSVSLKERFLVQGWANLLTGGVAWEEKIYHGICRKRALVSIENNNKYLTSFVSSFQAKSYHWPRLMRVRFCGCHLCFESVWLGLRGVLIFRWVWDLFVTLTGGCGSKAVKLDTIDGEPNTCVTRQTFQVTASESFFAFANLVAKLSSLKLDTEGVLIGKLVASLVKTPSVCCRYELVFLESKSLIILPMFRRSTHLQLSSFVWKKWKVICWGCYVVWLIFHVFGMRTKTRQSWGQLRRLNEYYGCAGVSLPFVTSQRPDRPELFFFSSSFLAHPVCSAEQAEEAQGERFPFLVHSQASDKIFLENSGQVNSE